MKRFYTSLSVLSVLALFGPAVRGAETRPNVVVFFADDMGIGDLPCYGAPDIRTPNLDALAEKGLRFTNFYSAAPVCSPSRAALLTGRYPIRAGVPSNMPSLPDKPGMPAGEVTLGELLRPAGYATALIGKWHLGTQADNVPNAQGFDEFFGHLAGCIDFWSHMFYYRRSSVPHHDLHRNRTEVFEYGHSMTDLIAREALRFIEAHKGEPFLLYVPFNAPHYPMQAPRRLTEPYADLRKNRMEYAGHVAHLDEVVGKIVGRLGGLKLLAKTAVFFLSDNGHSVEARADFGGGSAGPHRGHKFSLFEGGIRMPFIVSFPARLPMGQTRDQVGIAMDIFPTIAELTGTPLPKGRTLDGHSLLPILEDNAPSQHETLYWHFGKQWAVRSGNWKLVINPRQDIPKAELPKTYLSDLDKDLGEKHNLADKHPEVVQRLTELHETWLADVKKR